MRRPIIALLAVAGLTLSACAAGTAVGSNPPVAAQPNITVNNPGADQSGISVSGTGEVTGTPDTLSVDIGVSVLGKTVADAVAEAADKADALINVLKDQGVEERDITTANYSIYPEYDYRGNTERLVGYRVNNTVRVKIRDLDRAGDIIDAAVAAAREAAWNDALAKARQLAELSGQPLGPVISITETVSRPPTPVFFEGDFAATRVASTPIEPGTSSITISLQVHFALGG